ncbi:MAG: 5'-nucleotidase C-terminal domain-containing protein, partial [Deltaproteobacteria bacterium]|nr:5'-nucleotidase C-terminal domain-containing protein [Deltaproteobacteria bacterium]
NYRYLPEDTHLSEKIKRYEIFYLVDGKFLKKGQGGFLPQEGVEYFKVGVFGLSTNEAAYQFFFDPVRVLNPLSEARKTVLHLRRTEKVDVIILLSHLLDEDDIAIAQGVSSVDVIIGGHSHNKVIPNENHQPIVIKRPEEEEGVNTTWLAKSGEFAKYVGQMDLVFDTTNHKMLWNKSQYSLKQIDKRFEEDPEIKSQIESYKDQLTQKYKDIFTDHVADTTMPLVKSGTSESYLGNLAVNAIYERTQELGVQFAINNSEFFSHGFVPGPIRSVDIYNALPLIYDPIKDMSWTIWTFNMDGATLKKAMDLVFMLGRFFDVGGLEIIYNPDQFPEKVVSLKHHGEEILDDRVYKIASSQGIIEALKQVKDELPGLTNIEDTHVELWPVLREYFKGHSPLHSEDSDIKVSGRIRTVQPDLTLLSEHTKTHFMGPESRHMEISMRVQNLGYGGLLPEEVEKAQTDPTELLVYYDATPEDTTDDMDPFNSGTQFMPARLKFWRPKLDSPPPSVKLIEKLLVPSLKKDELTEVIFDWDISSLAPSEFPYTIYLFLKRASGTGFISVPLEAGGKSRKFIKMEESNLENNKAKVFVYLDQKVHPKNNSK